MTVSTHSYGNFYKNSKFNINSHLVWSHIKHLEANIRSRRADIRNLQSFPPLQKIAQNLGFAPKIYLWVHN